MRPWQFSKPKTPGFGISKGFYLTVLASKAVLPSIAQITNPHGDGGAVVGFGVPLKGGEKQLLDQPLARGAYAVATKDRKTVLRMLALSKDEAGFDPEVFARSTFAAEAEPELLARLRGTWTVVQFTYESHDPMVYPSLDFLQALVIRLATLADGVIADPICGRYLLPEQAAVNPRTDQRIDVRDHVVVKIRPRPDGWHAYTLGLQKLALPELEIGNLLDDDRTLAIRLLMALSQAMVLGHLLKSGDQLGSSRMPFEVREGGFDRSLWEGLTVNELLPPTKATAGEALAAWWSEQSA